MAAGTGGDDGRLSARPGAGATAPAGPGTHRLGLGGRRDGLLYVPAGLAPGAPAALAVLLHGAGGDAAGTLGILRGEADRRGMALLVPESRGRTWDVILGRYGPDVAFIDRALGHAFGQVPVDPARVAVAGFSDGASYALSLGVMNGDLFAAALGFSPGFMAPLSTRGSPRLYLSHGVEDRVLPIDACSRRLVPRLEAAGYEVLYREFPDGHTVPPDIAAEGVGFFLRG